MTVFYEVRRRDGSLAAVHKRTDSDSDSGKSMAWLSPDGTPGLNGTATAELPLYGAHLLDTWPQDVPLIVVEGEKVADALRAVGIAAVATVTGAAGTPSAASLAVLTGRAAVCAPDADEPGLSHMGRVADGLVDVAAVGWLAPPPDAPKGWDLADAIAEGKDVRELLRGAVAWPLAVDAIEVRTYPEPEDMGAAEPSELADVSYVRDLLMPGRIHVLGAEEGTGKTYAAYEMAVRVAIAGGSVAGSWEVERTGPVVYLSEMHRDDDLYYQAEVLDSLDVERSALTGRLYRLDLGTAANGAPVLTDADWRVWLTGWCARHGIVLAIFDTGTGATQTEPWGREMQQVYRDLRVMLAEYPALAVVLLLHLRKPGRDKGSRRITDVLGEWARWCDVLILMESDGSRVKVSTHKRVRHHKRIVAVPSGGLLIDPEDVTDKVSTRKVPDTDVLAAIVASPGITRPELAAKLGVGKQTVSRYVDALSDRVRVAKGDRRVPDRYWPLSHPLDPSGSVAHSGSQEGEPPTEPLSEPLWEGEVAQWLTTPVRVVSTVSHPPDAAIAVPVDLDLAERANDDSWMVEP